MVEKITREAMDRSRVYDTFTYFVDTIGPRLTASPAYKTAAEWSREQLAYGALAAGRVGKRDEYACHGEPSETMRTHPLSSP